VLLAGEPTSCGQGRHRKRHREELFHLSACNIASRINWLFCSCRTMDQMVRSMSTAHPDVDYIFLTGDFPAHDVWRQSRKANTDSAKVVVDIITKYFPSKWVSIVIQCKGPTTRTNSRTNSRTNPCTNSHTIWHASDFPFDTNRRLF
jgi:hypothetical protein